MVIILLINAVVIIIIVIVIVEHPGEHSTWPTMYNDYYWNLNLVI